MNGYRELVFCHESDDSRQKNISGKQFQGQIGGSYEALWHMLKLIRQTMGNDEKNNLFEVVVMIGEIDI
jgi:hypothetical protein